jgi:2-dehydro-3-deoxygluconokinase
MERSERVFAQLKEYRLIALLAPRRPEDCLAAWRTLEPLGVVLEVALRTPAALEGIRRTCREHPEALLLAGTVMTARQAEAAIEAGAAGIVSADYLPEVVDRCCERDVLCLPGGLGDAGKQLVRKAAAYDLSLEELRAQRPWQWGYKLFPAFAGEVCNSGYAPAWRGPYPGLTVVHTGGITLQTLPEAVRRDPAGIFCGSALSRHLDQPEWLADEVARWRRVLESAAARTGAAVAPAPGPSRPADRLPRVVTFGELMLRLSPPAGARLQEGGHLEACFGGAEANVAVSLARFGCPAALVTALPADELGERALRELRGHGVDTSAVVRRGPRLGVYHLELGSGVRGSKVVYDRAGSAFALMGPGEVDWERVLEGAGWFHWSGITPALGEGAAALLREALAVARARGIPVSADLNFRSRLWPAERAREVLEGLLPGTALLLANEEDPATLFGLRAAGVDVAAGRLEAGPYRKVARALRERFGCGRVALTLRRSLSASENEWSACLDDGREFRIGPTYRLPVLDRSGTGDAFAAGLIHGLLSGMEAQAALDFGVAAGALKHSLWGDFNRVDASEVEAVASGRTGGRIER